MESADILKMDVTDLIPQRPPFVMVDKLACCDITDAVTELLVRPDNLFCEDGLLSTQGMLENMAQSCAARMGWLNLMNDKEVKIGFIGEIKKCKFLRRPKVGEHITTHIHIIEDIFNLTLASATMMVDGETVATTIMKIATVEKDS